MSAPRPRRLRLLPVLAATFLLPVLVLATPAAPAVSASPTGPATPAPQNTPGGAVPELRLSDVSSWVAAEGTFSATFEAPPTVPPDARLVWTVHQSLSPRDSTVREAVRSINEGATPGRALQPTVRAPLAEYLDGQGRVRLDVPIRSRSARRTDDLERLLVPNPGVHPVSVSIETASGDTLAATVVHLLRLPADPTIRPGAISFLVRIDSNGPTVRPDGQPALGLEGRAALRAAIDLMEAAGGSAALAARPGLLANLARLEGGTRTVARLREAVGNSAVLRLGYTRLDLGGLIAAGGLPDVQADLVRGTETTAAYLRRPDGRVWPPDATLTNAAVPALAGLGVDRLLVQADQVPDAPDDARLVRLGPDGPSALRLDTRLGLALVEDATTPALVANRFAAEVAGAWFDAEGRAALAVEVPTVVEPDTLERVVTELRDGDLVRLVPMADVFDADTGDRPEVALVDPPPGDSSEFLAPFRVERDRLTAVTSMFPTSSPRVEQIREVLSASIGLGLTPFDRRAYLTSVERGIDEILGAISAPEERNVTVTSRRTTVPLRLRNELDEAVDVVLTLRSPLLEFPEGRNLPRTLAPGENRVEIPVVARGSGQFALNVTVVTPAEGLELGEGRLRIRSTVVSGVGAALSVGALAVLAVWWWRTARRRRREATNPTPSSG